MYLATYDGYSVSVADCDMDADNEITIKDCTEIQKILAGMN
jgi:hypothetical protein